MRTAVEAARAVAAGEVSPLELVEDSLRAAELWQAATNAFSRLHPEEARADAVARAEAVARREELGPLHGVPIAVKDLFDVAGWETTGCSKAYRDRVASSDAEVIGRLRAAGAVIIGKTNQHELAAGATNVVSACGPARNPWDPDRMTGGSSGGSGAAVAAGVVPFALGTDTGGSVRIPASLCGVSALKPTWGAVSLDGVMPLAPSLDTVGPLAVSIDDVALAFEVLSGRRVERPRGVTDVRVAFVSLHDTPVRRDVTDACEALVRTLEDAGARRVEVSPLTYEPDLWARIGWREFHVAHAGLLERAELLGRPTREFLEDGARRSAEDYEAARREAGRLRDEFLARLREADILVAATTPFPAPLIDEPLVPVGDEVLDWRKGAVSVLTRPVNLAGLPALAVPCGWADEGLPLGAQLIGRPGEEELLLEAGRAFQEATDHHRRRPAVPSDR